MHDVLLYYAKSDAAAFNVMYEPASESYQKRFGGKTQVLDPETRSRKLVIDQSTKGMPLRDVWNLSILAGFSQERVGYPTQKPLALLDRVVKASSNEGDVVLNPFCGCATTCVSAHALGRLWTGIDSSPKAAELVVQRLRQTREGQQVSWMTQVDTVIHRTDIPQRTDLGRLPPYNCSANRQRLYGEQGGSCAGCSTHFEPRHLEVDHIISQAKGGTDHVENLQLLCGSCNRIKGDRGMEYLKAKLQIA